MHLFHSWPVQHHRLQLLCPVHPQKFVINTTTNTQTVQNAIDKPQEQFLTIGYILQIVLLQPGFNMTEHQSQVFFPEV